MEAKQISEMTREELEEEYFRLFRNFADILAEKKEYEKKYYDKPTYVDERNKMYNLRFANRCLCGLLAPLIAVFYSIKDNWGNFSFEHFGLGFVIYLIAGLWILFLLRGISEADFDKWIGWGPVLSKAIMFISLVVSCVLMALSM